MSLKEYEDLDAIRLEEGKKSNAHYKSVNLPGTRKKEGNSAADVKARIAAMKAEREKAGQV